MSPQLYFNCPKHILIGGRLKVQCVLEGTLPLAHHAAVLTSQKTLGSTGALRTPLKNRMSFSRPPTHTSIAGKSVDAILSIVPSLPIGDY
jgi:hypothetical protein